MELEAQLSSAEHYQQQVRHILGFSYFNLSFFDLLLCNNHEVINLKCFSPCLGFTTRKLILLIFSCFVLLSLQLDPPLSSEADFCTLDTNEKAFNSLAQTLKDSYKETKELLHQQNIIRQSIQEQSLLCRLGPGSWSAV